VIFLIDVIKRLALFQAHNERCAYCRQPLLFADMTTDHILPQALKRDPVQTKKILKEFDLPETFDIESYENWLPCHQGENRQKGSTIFSKSTILFFIEIAALLKP
jgi:5-methylcytosine-specific restriction endonuclease McrA